jgi:hypothetical protein
MHSNQTMSKVNVINTVIITKNNGVHLITSGNCMSFNDEIY